MIVAVVLGMVLKAATGGAGGTCEPGDAAERVAARVPVAIAVLSDADVAGRWSQDDGIVGLSGSDLYLFGDGTYIYAEWADVLPETIFDKGSWRTAAGTLQLSPDSDVTWEPRTDRCFVFIRIAGRSAPLLLGVGQGLRTFERLVAENPKDALRYLMSCTLTRRDHWSAKRALRLRARLMKKCWRPWVFTGVPDDNGGSGRGKAGEK